MTNSIGDFDGHFDQVKGFLTPYARQLLALPDCAEVGRNLVSMGNYLPLLHPLLRAISPSLICEIGAYRGITTRALAELSVELGARLDVVDPAIRTDDAPVKAQHVEYQQMLSEEYLALQRSVEVFFIDGDHNYEVVTKELILTAGANLDKNSPIVIMHDVGWPWAYRDLYYDRSRINNPQKDIATASVSLTREDSEEFQISLPMDIEYSGHEGGPCNGVRKAIEDFLERQEEWRFINIPSLYGLGVLWNSSRVTDRVSAELEKLSSLFDTTGSFLAILELNRLLLLSEIAKQGEEWRANQDYIATADRRAAELNSQVAELDGQVAELDGQVAELDGRVAELDGRVAELDGQVEYLESWKGALRQLLRKLIRRT